MILATYCQRLSLFDYWCRWVPKGVGTIALLVVPLATPVKGQQPSIPGLDLNPLQQTLQAVGDERISMAQVRLDGQRLFTIAAPALVEGQSNVGGLKPVQQRSRNIEKTLNQIAENTSDVSDLSVSYSIDPKSGLPVITVNSKYLMTVTTLDAQIHGSNPERLADELVTTIKDALSKAINQRQSHYLNQQGYIAAGILLGMVTTSGAITWMQRRVYYRQRKLQLQLPTWTEMDNPSEIDGSQPVLLRQQQQNSLFDVKRRVLQISQVSVWGGGTFLILGLFPYTRWLQTVVLSAPLKVIVIGLSIYVLIRLSDTVIDRLFSVLEREQLPSVAKSQRFVLRISTVSRVAKSATSILLVGAGTLAGLGILGVDLVPLLAGAGIVGLAVSFASQNLIKDVINGFLILFEDQYAVGDVISVGDVGGFVENMNLRITQLRDNEGRLITIPNSQINIVQNLSKGWSRVDLTIEIAVHTEPDRALRILEQIAEEMYQDSNWADKMLEVPEVLGIDDIAHSGMLIRIWIKTKPLQQWAVGREFRRRLKQIMQQKGLAIGVPQRSLTLSNAMLQPEESRN